MENSDRKRDGDGNDKTGTKNHNINPAKIHTSTATSAKLLRLYK